MLRRQRTEQKAERLRAGNQWTDSGLVSTTEFGGPVDPRNLLRVMESAAKAAGVDGVGVHTLRHSAAVGWLEAGVHIKAVAGPAWALIDRRHGRRVRPHKRRHGASGGRWPGRAAGALECVGKVTRRVCVTDVAEVADLSLWPSTSAIRPT